MSDCVLAVLMQARLWGVEGPSLALVRAHLSDSAGCWGALAWASVEKGCDIPSVVEVLDVTSQALVAGLTLVSPAH